MLWCSVVLLALFASVQGRAVNISNTWVLPEEGFPVFYRYFRDRISWYEADAVCQFHHANLVTVDTTAQYDAVRAYLKELDISSAVWVGLIRSNPDGDFTWTDYRGLSSEGYWSSAPDSRAAPLCAAADPAADYRWEARACGGPTVASFICELPVPQWALGNEGCMVRALPALTILYLPESAAVQLTADCGLAGVKRVQCTGNVKREDLLRDLSCSEEEEEGTTTASITSSGNTWPITTDSVFTDQDTTTETTTEDNTTTEHENDINQSSTVLPSSTIRNVNLGTEYKLPTKPITTLNKFNRINYNLDKNLDLALAHSNNLQSNFIPKIAYGDNYLSNEQRDKLEDEKHMQHKMLHEEIARLGNLENIFTQPTDHFVPPLVMAKAKISDDMTVLSLQEKHAQQLAEEHMSKQNTQYVQNDHIYSNIIKSTTGEPKAVTVDKLLFMQTMKSKDNNKKDKTKTAMPKKYNEKVYDPKSKIQKLVDMKPMVFERITDSTLTQTETVTKHTETTSLPLVGRVDIDDDSLDLTVLLKDNPDVHEKKQFYNYSGDVSKLEVVKNSGLFNGTEVKFYDIEATEETKQKGPSKYYEDKRQNISSDHEVINITIISEEHISEAPTTFENTTNVHIFEENTSTKSVLMLTKNPLHEIITTTNENVQTTVSLLLTESIINSSKESYNINNVTKSLVTQASTSKSPPIEITTTEAPIIITTPTYNITSTHENLVPETTTTASPDIAHEENIEKINVESHEEFDTSSNSSDTLDDFNSPLLSGANEPIRRPNRSRRPQQPPNRNKFNPFRILG